MQGSANDREESADLDAYTKGEPSLLLERAEKVLNIRPGQPRAHALKLVALYRLGRYREMPAAYAEAARYDVRRPQLHREPLYAAMESDELKARRLPDADREGLFPPSVRPEDRGGRPFRKP